VDELPEDDLIRIGGNVEVNVEQNQAKGEESLAALKSLFG
jgi:ATP-dependent DNA helicase Rep